ncbi:hypothetical protein E3226_011015 [Legionella geestiana]|uniref:hypothetical protein n=1 Tax=Legionella geestiana TaxID=45065 RepID=UPI001091CB29|nr:hypothetical protein [Legionella geestiana]QDQ40893.1 hypothetical protein E3226_011015 [Legionella geestiana]
MRFKWLYTPQKEDNLKVFVRNPPGKLSIARLLRQMPAFEQRRVGEILKPADIMINIWTRHLDPQAVKRKIVELMQQGHRVFLANKPSQPLSEEWIEHGEINFFENATRPYNEILTFCNLDDRLYFIRSYKTVREEYLAYCNSGTHILTHYDMECLLKDDDKLQISTVMADDFLHHESEFTVFNNVYSNPEENVHNLRPDEALSGMDKTKRLNQQMIDPEGAKTLQIATRVICKTFHTSFGWHIGRDTKSASHQYLQYLHEPQFTTAVFHDADISGLLSGRELGREPCNFKPEYLASLRSVGYILPRYQSMTHTLYDYTNPFKSPVAADIAGLLRHTPNLEHLMLGRVAISSNNWPSLPRLRKLTTGYVTNTASFFRLLEQSTGLEELQMYHSLSPDMTATLRPLVSVKRYKELRIPLYRRVDGNMRVKLLQSMPNLEHLEIHINGCKNFNFPRLPLLKTLLIDGQFGGTPVTLFSHFPALESLDLKYAEIIHFNASDRERLISALAQSNALISITPPEFPRYRHIKEKILFWETVLEHAPPNLCEKSKDAIRDFLTLAKKSNKPSSFDLGDKITGVGGILENFFSGQHGDTSSSSSSMSSGSSSSGARSSKDTRRRSNKDANPHSHAPSNTNAHFNPEDMEHHRPSDEDNGFTYSGGHEALNQQMVIDQYCHYIQSTRGSVPNIHDGICNALSHLCASMAPQKWQANLELLRSWDGKLDSLTKNHYLLFEKIGRAIETYQEISFRSIIRHVTSGEYARTWLGEQAVNWLSAQKAPNAFILSNPWHAICVRRLHGEPARFAAYNPNFKEGNLIVTAENLTEFLEQSLGNLSLIVVEGTHRAENLTLSNPEGFIATGGIFHLSSVQNQEVLLELLNGPIPATPEILKGIFLRDLDGIPLWYSSMSKKALHPIILPLIAGFLAQHPHNWWNLLQESAECVKGFKLEKALTALHKQLIALELPDEIKRYVSEIPELLKARRKQVTDTRKMQPECNAASKLSLSEKLEALAASEKPSHLITVRNSAVVRRVRFALEREAQALGRSVIYIDNPSDLTLSNPFVEMQVDGKTGHFKTGPGGAVHKVITSAVRPLIIVNYDNFPPASRVAFNTLFDDMPMADGVPLPEGTTVVALQNLTNTASYKGSDMSSRFKERDVWNMPEQQYPDMPEVPEHRAEDNHEEAVIELYQGADWKERLLGTWSPRGNSLVWMEGELEAALNRSPHLRIQNAPVHDPDYEDFWREAILKGHIVTERGLLRLPEGFSRCETTGFDWEALTETIVSVQTGLAPHCPHTLNSNTLEDFLTHYDCDANGLLHADENHLETLFGKNSEITLNISHTLCMSDLARFIAACKALNIRLNFRVAENVELPEELVPVSAAQSASPVINVTSHTRLLSSNDPDAACELIKEQEPNALVIDISECDAGHLIDTIDGGLSRENAQLQFKNRKGLLPERLQNGQTLILTGTFSDEIAETLTPLLLARYASEEAPGKLVLIPHNPRKVALDFLPVESLNASDKKMALVGGFFNPETLENHSLVELDAMLRHTRATTEDGTQNAWAGLHRLDVRLQSEPFDAENSAAKAHAFQEGRLASIDTRLAHAPFVVITGLTGVGKSTTIERAYAERYPNIHYGEEAIRAFAKDRRPGRKTLFLDEANISGNDWSMFEGLYQNPPFVRIGHEILELTEEHRIIFACNPVNYGDRKLPSLFERHGNALVFEPMPKEYIYEEMLKPLLSLKFEPELMADIAREFLRVYHFLCECSETSVLISPRELVMMARMTMAHTAHSPMDAARHYARLITKDLVPQKHRARFNHEFPPVAMARISSAPASVQMPICSSSEQQASISAGSTDFLVTRSREPLANLIDDLLNLREMGRAMNPETTPKDFLCGGLGGLIIEGAPGQGKSELVKNLLKARGYGNNPDKGATFIAASMNEDKKRATLLEAFDRGAVVILDEINSCPMMEDFLNDLLMGKHPIESKRPAKVPGFLLIGTQNPASMGGRQRTSNAIMRRVISHNLPNYTLEEMMEILTTCPIPGVSFGLSRMRALHLMKIYEEHASRGMTFRDVLKRARDIVHQEHRNAVLPDEEDFGFTLETLPEDDAGFTLETLPLPARKPIPADLESLFDAIDALRAHAHLLQAPEHHEARERVEGLTAMKLAADLEAKARQFAKNRVAHRGEFRELLSEGFNKMSTHRNTWHPILVNILRAFEAVLSLGLPLILHGSSFFTVKTERQRLVNRVSKVLDALPDDTDTPNNMPQPELMSPATGA